MQFQALFRLLFLHDQFGGLAEIHHVRVGPERIVHHLNIPSRQYGELVAPDVRN
jgi:hypothetical protein